MKKLIRTFVMDEGLSNVQDETAMVCTMKGVTTLFIRLVIFVLFPEKTHSKLPRSNMVY